MDILLIKAFELLAFAVSAIAFGYGAFHLSSKRNAEILPAFCLRRRLLYARGIVGNRDIMVQSAYPLLGILLPIATYIPLIIVMSKKRSRKEE